MFYRGLKDNIKDELIRGGNYLAINLNSETDDKGRVIDGLFAITIKINDTLYKRAIEKRHTGQFRGRSGYISFSGTRG